MHSNGQTIIYQEVGCAMKLINTTNYGYHGRQLILAVDDLSECMVNSRQAPQCSAWTFGVFASFPRLDALVLIIIISYSRQWVKLPDALHGS